MNATPSNGTGSRARLRGVDRAKLPHNTNNEASILGGILVRNEVLAELADLEVDDFHDLKHKVVFGAMRALEAAGKPIDVVTLELEIERQEKLDAIGGVAFLGELALSVPTAANVVTYAAEVKRDSRNRRAIIALSSALERAQNWPHAAEELVSEVAGELQRIEIDHAGPEQDRAGKPRWAVPMLDFLGDEEPDDNDAVDWIIRDLVPRGEPVIWGGPMKAGKTWGVMDLAIAMALGEGWLGRFDNTVGEPVRVMGLFLEDNKRRMSKRLHELSRARGRVLLSDETLRSHLFLSRASLRLPDAKDQRALIKEIKRTGVRVVIIDNLTRVIVGDPNSSRDAALFTRAWTEVGEETGATILFLHHTKKPTGDKEIDPFDQLRGSGDFGAASRNMVVTMPLRLERGLCAEVRMRGNLDLRCDSFALGFERWPDDRWNGRHCAKLVDLGDVAQLKDEAKKHRKEKKEAAKKADKAAEFAKRRERALELVHQHGHVSQAMLALDLGMSARAMGPLFRALVDANVLKADGPRGYVLADRQGDLSL